MKSPPSKHTKTGHKSLHLNEPLSPMKSMALVNALHAQNQPLPQDVHLCKLHQFMVIVVLANKLLIVQSTNSINVLIFIIKHPNLFLNLLKAPDWKTYFNFDTPLNIHLHLNVPQ